ncbi:MAG: ABC transporter permease [Rhodobacteraceae bacterium]|nr:ABC transporter permease [Paracoccaceae bacterium]
MIVSLAWRNIWRQPVRTTLSVVGMAFASLLLVFMASFQFGAYDTMKSSMLKISDGFGQFQPVGYKDDPEIEKVIADPAALMAEAEQIAGITASTLRSNGFGLLANGERSFAAAIVGVEPGLENKVSKLDTMVERGRALTPDDDAAIVLGEGLARNLRLELGDQVTLLGSGLDGSVAADVLTLVGIFKSGIPEIDRTIARMPLQRFDDTFAMNGAVHIVALSAESVPAVERAEPELRALAARHGLVYLNWGELQPGVKQAIDFDLVTSLLMYVTLVVVVVFIILNTLYMSVLERTREFGVLLAIGMKPGQIGRMVWMEMIFLSLFGNGVGIVLGMALTGYFTQVGISFAGMEEIYAQWGLPSRMYPTMTFGRVLGGPGAVVAAIGVLGIIPYRRVLGLTPVKAMAA